MSARRLGFFVLYCGLAAGLTGRADVLPAESDSLDLKAPFATKSDWRVTVYGDAGDPKIDSDIASTAKICFTGGAAHAEKCSSLNDLTSVSSPRPSQKLTALAIVPLWSGQSAVKALVVRYEGAYATGVVDQTAIWVYDSARDDFRLASALATSGQGEQRLFNSGPMDGYLVTADYILGDRETRWDDHRYRVHIYRYADGAYGPVLDYETAAKYPSETVTAIESELPSMPKRLKDAGH